MEITALSRAPARAVNESAARASDIALQQSSGRATEQLITTDLWPHGLTAQGREMRACALPSRVDARGRAIGATVADLIEQEWITALKQRSGRAEIAVAVDGRPVARAAWRETPLKGGEIVTLRAALADGGGDKNPLRTILQIGVLVAAIVVPPLLFTATWAQTLAGAAITIAGGLIVNAIAPPILPDAARPRAIEPIYSLSGGANRARAYEPLLLVLGAHRVFPDLGAAEYTEISGDDHVLHQIFNFGLGDLAVDDLRIGTTALDSYEEVETEFGDARGRITLVAGNVDSIAGGALDDTQWLERTTAAGTRRIGVDITGRLFRIDDEGEIQANSAEIEIEWRAPGQATQRRTITLMHDSQAPLRRTFAYDLASAGTWTVRVRRTADPDPSDRVHDELAWAALRAYQIDDGDYSGQTRLGLRIRATGQLSGRLDRLSAMVRQRVPTWDGARWTAPCRDLQSGLAVPLVCAGPAYRRPPGRRRRLAGYAHRRGLDQGLGRMVRGPGARLQSRARPHPLPCRGADHDRPMRPREPELADRQARRRLGGRRPPCHGPDYARQHRRRLVRGRVCRRPGGGRDRRALYRARPRLAVQHAPPPRAGCERAAGGHDHDHARRRDLGRARGDRVQSASRAPALPPPALELGDGGRRACDRARRRGAHHPFADRRRRRRPACRRHGRARDPRPRGRSPRAFRRDHPSAGAGEMLFRLPDGTVHRSAVSAAGGAQGETAEIELDDPLPEAPGAQGASPLDTLWRLYDASLPPVRARITAVEPATDRRVRFTAIDEVEAYYAAATADLSAPLPVLSARAPRVLGVAFAEALVRVGAGFAVEIAAVLTTAGDWRGGIVRASVDDAPPRIVARLVDGETAAQWLAPPAGTLTLTVTPGTEAAPAGAPFTARYEIVGSLAPPGVPTNFLIDVLGDGTRRLRWQPPADVDLAGVLIRYGAAGGTPLGWDQLTPLHRGHLTASPLETVEPPPGHWVFAARAIDTGGRLSTGDVRIVAELGPQRQGDALLWRCPSAAGWPGRLTDIERSDDGHDALEGAGDYTWDDLTTWDAWQSWGAGNGTAAAAEFAFAAEPVDLGIAFDVALRWSAEIVGDGAFEYRAGDTQAALADAAWTAYTPAVTVRARWLQLRWRVTGDGSRVLSLDHLCWSAHAPGAERKLLDRNTADWQGTAAAGRIVPVDLGVVTDLDVTLQSVGAGWSWTLLSKNNPTRIRIYDGDGNPADAVVDAVVRGVAT